MCDVCACVYVRFTGWMEELEGACHRRRMCEKSGLDVETPCLCATRLDATATGLMSAGTETVAERFISFDMDLCKDNKTRDAFEISGNVCTLSNC